MTDAYFFTEKKETNHTHGRIQKNRSVYLYAGKQKEFIRMEEFRRTYIEKKKIEIEIHSTGKCRLIKLKY